MINLRPLPTQYSEEPSSAGPTRAAPGSGRGAAADGPHALRVGESVVGPDQMVVGKYRKIVTPPGRSAVGRSKERDNLCAKIKMNATCSVARAFYTESRPFTPNTELTVAPWDTPTQWASRRTHLSGSLALASGIRQMMARCGLNTGAPPVALHPLFCKVVLFSQLHLIPVKSITRSHELARPYSHRSCNSRRQTHNQRHTSGC